MAGSKTIAVNHLVNEGSLSPNFLQLHGQLLDESPSAIQNEVSKKKKKKKNMINQVLTVLDSLEHVSMHSLKPPCWINNPLDDSSTHICLRVRNPDNEVCSE